MVIDASGNVGIGSNNPNEKLEVAGNVNITGSMIFGGSNMTTLSDGNVEVW